MTAPHTSRSRYECELDPDLGSPRLAREFVGRYLAPDHPRRDDVLVCVSELATNAVLHVGRSYRVSMVVDVDAVRVEVTDAGRARPHLRPIGADGITGRGMRIVDSLSDRWGVEIVGTGKSVWFEVARA